MSNVDYVRFFDEGKAVIRRVEADWGGKSNVGNYRPVSLTSVICKIVESIIRDSILEYMVRNNLFSNDQHGFVPSRDCMTNLLLTIETLTSIIEDGGAVDIIYGFRQSIRLCAT